MFKINNTLFINPIDKLLIIKKIINLRKQQGGSIDLSDTSRQQLERLTNTLHNTPVDTSKSIENSNTENSYTENSNTEIIELLNIINGHLSNSDITELTSSLRKLYMIVNQNVLIYSKKYKDILDKVMKDINDDGLSMDTSRTVQVLMDNIAQDPLLVKEQVLYVPLRSSESDTVLQSRSSQLEPLTQSPPRQPVALPQTPRIDTPPVPLSQTPLQPVSPPTSPTKEHSPDQMISDEINETYLSQIEKNLVYMLLHTVDIKKLNTWEKISTKYKLLYNLVVFGNNDSVDMNEELFMYSYTDIAFVQNIINFNHFGLIHWDVATKKIKNYINDLYLFLKGTPEDNNNNNVGKDVGKDVGNNVGKDVGKDAEHTVTEQSIGKILQNNDESDKKSVVNREDLMVVVNDSVNDSDSDSENNSEDDIEKYVNT